MAKIICPYCGNTFKDNGKQYQECPVCHHIVKTRQEPVTVKKVSTKKTTKKTTTKKE